MATTTTTASSPQAWAVGTPLLVLRVLLSLEPGDPDLRNDSVSPDGVDRISLIGIPWRATHAYVEAQRRP